MKRTISAVLICLLVFTMLPLSAFADEGKEEQAISDTELILPEEEEIYEGTGSLAYAFDDSFIRNYVDNEQLDEAGHVARIHDEEELDTYVFLNRDGTKSVYYMDDNVRYVDENGERVEKDLTLVRKNKGYSLKASDVKLWFPDVLSDGISVKYDNFHLTLYPQGIADTEEAVIDEFDRITYPGVFGENTVLAYTPTLSGLKEDIIVTEYTGQLSYDFLIHTHGMRILEQNGKWIVKKPGNGNKETFELGAVQIYDSAGNFCVGEMTVTAQNNGSKYILTLTAPEEFMTDPDTVYPVTIDPTIEVSDNVSGGSIEDSVIYSGTPAANYGGFTYLTVGYNGSTYGIGRALFRLPGLYNSTAYTSVTGAQIQSVYFYAWDASGHDDLPIELYPVLTSSWTESGVTWNNAPGYYTGTDTLPRISTAMPSNDYGCFDITTLVKWWKSGRYATANCGFILKNPNETSETYKKVPCSSETAVTTRRPYVVMTYAAEASIVSSRDYVTGGTTLSLSVTSNGTVQSVVWASSDSSIATITQNGLLFGSNAGSVRITATVTFSDNTTCVAEKNFFVTVPNGVYRISNKNSGYYLNVQNSKIADETYINQVASTDNASSSVTTSQRLSQLWKISYIGGGCYSIRPMHKLNMGLTDNGVDVCIVNIGETDSLNSVTAMARWTILCSDDGYTIRQPGTGNCALQIANASTAIGAFAANDSYNEDSAACYWVLSQVTNAGSGIILYDAETSEELTDDPVKLYVAPEETVALSSKIRAAVYASYTNNQTITWSMGYSSFASYSNGTLIGKKYSETSNATLTGTAGGLTSNKTVNVSVCVTAIPNGTYYVQNKETGKFLDISSGAYADGLHTEQYSFDSSSDQKWKFTHLGDGYYSIKLYENNAYHLQVKNNSTDNDVNIVLSSGIMTDGARWKVTTSSSGATVITPKTGEANNRVMAVGYYLSNTNGINIQQRDYVQDDNYKDEWELYNLSISIVNYYDSSFASNQALVNNIASANEFVEDVFYELFGLSIKMDGAATPKSGTPADVCKAEEDAIKNGEVVSGELHCDGNCSVGDGRDCKDVVRNSEYIYNSDRENSHIYVMWTNRNEGANCSETTKNGITTHEIFYGYASVLEQDSEHIPVVYVNRIPEATTTTDASMKIEYQRIAMCLILAHEIAHTLGLEEMYDSPSHCSNNENCIMNRLETDNTDSPIYYVSFYNDIIEYLSSDTETAPFCAFCENELGNLIANLLIEGN